MVNYILMTLLLFQVGDLPSFQDGVIASQENNKPLLLIVTGNSCAPCEKLKRIIIPNMIKNKDFDSVNLAIINIDEEKDQNLLSKILKGRQSKPQMILFFDKNGPKRATLIGISQSDEATKGRIRELIKLGKR